MEIIEIGRSKKLHYSFPEHQHGFWEILLNTNGNGVFLAEGKEYEFHPGTILVIPPYTPHQKKSNDGFLDRSVFLKNFRNIGRSGVKLFEDDERQTIARIFDLVEQFQYDETNQKGETEASITSVLGDLLYQVLVSYYNQSKKKDIRLEGVIELMNENVSNAEFELSKAIQSSGYSMGYFRKIFKEMTGQLPVNYFNSLRIGKAKSMFQQYGNSRTVKEIAYSCGFSDALYFSRVFRQLEGISPQQYIRTLKKEMTPEDIRLVKMDTPEEFLNDVSE